MKIILTIVWSLLIASVSAQRPPGNDTAVFYNAFSWSPDGAALCFSVIVMPGEVFNAKHWEVGFVISNSFLHVIFTVF